MKINLNVPDDIKCAFIGFVRNGDIYPEMYMQAHMIATNDLFDGNEITIKKTEAKKDE